MNYLQFESNPNPSWERFLEALRTTLSEVKPSRVRPENTLVVSEATEVVYGIVPHDSLGGFALVAATGEMQTALFWAAIGSLEYHDDLDLGWGHYTAWRADGPSVPIEELVLRFHHELSRPIRAYFRLQRDRVVRLECELLGGDINDHPQLVLRRSRKVFSGPLQEVVVESSLTSMEPLPVQVKPEVGRWRAA